ncbi:MAG: hypothetical protein ABI432_18935 [Flavobacteriales bacterium]
MRILFLVLVGALACHAGAQYDRFSFRYNYAFIEDSSALLPLQGTYRVEYLARGQWWSYMDPRTPVNYPGQPRVLKPLITVKSAPVMVVELGMDYRATDRKLRVVRGADTMIVDIGAYSDLEERMLARTAIVGVPPRPPVLLPFRKGWYDVADLIKEPGTEANTKRFDRLWKEQRTEVLAHYDTARYEFSLETDGLRIGPLEIPIMRDPNYARHLLHFPASGPGTHFELYRQDSLGVTEARLMLLVEMPPGGETGTWVDVTDLPHGKYTAFLKWGEVQSIFYLIFG